MNIFLVLSVIAFCVSFAWMVIHPTLANDDDPLFMIAAEAFLCSMLVILIWPFLIIAFLIRKTAHK